MNSCCGLWEQERKTGTVHWEGRGDIEWCVCDICAHTHTHTYAERVTSVSPITSSTRGALCNISPSSSLPLSSPPILFGFIPMPHRASSAIHSRHPSLQKENTGWLLGRLEWFLTPSSDLMIRNDELLLVRWGGCFGSVTYQLRKTLMEDSFASSVKRFQSCLWFSSLSLHYHCLENTCQQLEPDV